MKYALQILIVAAALAGGTVGGSAEEGPCQEKNQVKKVACLNTRLGVLEKLVKDLDARLVTVKSTADTAKQTADAAKAAADSASSAASGALKNGDSVKLASHYSAIKKCLWQPNFDSVNAVDCSAQILWRLEK